MEQSVSRQGAGWDAYLSALEAAALAMDAQVIAGDAPDHRVMAALEPPDEPFPPQFQHRRTLVLALLQDVAERAQARREAIKAELSGMPRRRAPQATAATSLGGTLDILG
jgi:hypothetical protein